MQTIFLLEGENENKNQFSKWLQQIGMEMETIVYYKLELKDVINNK
jgi:hypothetical protein